MTKIIPVGLRNGNAVESYSGDVRFESLPGHRLYCLKIFVVFLSPN
jgi:hypothetical protein